LHPKDILVGYAALATVATSPRHRQVVLDDPDDGEVIACAVNARASVIVSGDSHLLRIGFFEGISILSAAEFVKIYISP
jgi:predicted nucleic acid-binding protein